MKKRHFLFLSVVLCLFQPLQAINRTRYNFNPDWKLSIGDDSLAKKPMYDDSNWKSISLPYAFNGSEAFRLSIDKLTDTVVWYRKTFYLPIEARSGKIFIEFEGARQAAEVWINGQRLGLHENGITAFGYDMTGKVGFGSKKPNILAVRVDNDWKYKERTTGSSFQWNDSNFNANYGGLPKNVWLHVCGNLFQTLPLYNNLETKGIYVYADNFDIKGKRCMLHVESEVRNESNKSRTFHLNILVKDKDALLTKEFQSEEQTLQPGETKVITCYSSLKNVNFWSWGYGYLYEVNSSLVEGKKVVDMVKIRTGFRKTEFANGMFRLNDRVLQLKGYAQRTSNEWPGVGMSVPPWLSDYSNGLMVESNANLVRWLHVTPWKQDVESCDRVGLLQAMPAGDSEKDVDGRQWEQRTEVMRDAIIYNRNNPSIIFYESGNTGISEEHIRQMKVLRDAFDPKGGRAIGSREMLDSKMAEYGGEMLYINKSAHKPVWAMEYSRDESLRKYWDDKSYPNHPEGEGPLYRNEDASAYNHNQDLFTMEAVTRWYDYWRERPGTGKRVSSGGVSIIFSDSNTHYRGAENYRRSGKVDAMRIKKDAWWAHYVMWDGWVDTENQHTHIVGHWNYTFGQKKNVYVVSTGDKVELFLNNHSLGLGTQSSRFWFTFPDVAFSAGELKAVSYDSGKNILSQDTLRTVGFPKFLRLNIRQSPVGLHADGSDMVLAEVEVVDGNGVRCPLANDLVHFDLQGPVEFIGGIAQGSDNYSGSRDIPVECGVNRVLLRATRKAGAIKITVTSGTLRKDSASIESVPVEVVKGLSNWIPSANLPIRLNRGPTPQMASYVVSRVPVSVANITAGANEKEVMLSIDDNERTEWRSNNVRSTAWIKYDLVRAVSLSEICLKLTSFRTRSYQIRVLAEDNTVLWEGATPQSLGYITLPLKKGINTESVRVELLGAGQEKETFGAIVEVEAGKNLDLFDSNNPGKADPKEDLRIVEIEFYEAVND
jgi:beta-galactosidase